MNYTIYSITNQANGKQYIGYSERPERRWIEHQRAARQNIDAVLYRAMRKHGIENFTFEVIYTSENKNHTKKVMEPKFIAERNTIAPNGYNVAPGGDGGALRIGAVLTEETKRKISEGTKRGMNDPELRAYLSRKHKGKIISAETRAKQSAMRKKCRWYSHHELKTSIFRDASEEETLLRQGWCRGRTYHQIWNNPDKS